MGLYLYNGGILTVGGKLAASSNCCCGSNGICENDLLLIISGTANWDGSYLLSNVGDCNWYLETNNCGECSQITASIACDPEAGGDKVYQVTLYEFDCENLPPKAVYYRLIESAESICTETKTLSYLSEDGGTTCGPYDESEVSFTLTNNLCCACCTNCCDFVEGDEICATFTSECEHWDGRQYTLAFSEETNQFETVISIPDGEFAGAYGSLYLRCVDNVWESEMTAIFSTLSIEIQCSPFSGSVEYIDTTWPVCTGVPVTVTYSECP